jgi:regulator of protease activity HflC (stomatin/prohibitin superfamily)
MTAGFVLAVIFLIVVGFTIFLGIRIVPQGSKYVIQRLGKYHSTLARISPGPMSSKEI